MSAMPARLIGPVTLTATQDTYYICPASTIARIDKMSFVNYSGADKSVSVWIVINGYGPGDGNLVSVLTVPSGEGAVDVLSAWHTLNANDAIIIKAENTDSVAVTCSGVLFT